MSINETIFNVSITSVGGNLKFGLLFATIFPVVMIVGLIILIVKYKKGKENLIKA